MQFLTEAWLLNRYGARLTIQELAEVLKVNIKTVQNRLSQGELPIKTYNDSGRFVTYEDVAAYLNSFTLKK